MTFTYDGTLDTDLEKVRHLIDDKNEKDPLLSDEEINFHLDERGDIYLAAADACEAISIQLGRMIDRSAIGLSATPGRSATAYRDRAKDLRDQATARCSITVGGLSEDEKEDFADEDDAIQPNFSVGQDDQGGRPWENIKKQE